MKSSRFPALIVFASCALAGCATTQPRQFEDSVTSVAFSPGQSLLAVANSKEIRVYEAESRKHINTLRTLPADAENADPLMFRHGVGDSMVFLDGARIATTGMGGMVTIWDARSGRRIAQIDPPPGEKYASTLDYSQSAHSLIIGTSSGQLLKTRLEDDSLQTLQTIGKLEGYVWDLQLSRDGKYLASASVARTLDSAGLPEPRTEVPEFQVDEKANHMPEQRETEPINESSVTIWDVEVGELMGELDGAVGVSKMALVPGERALLTAGDEVQVWEFMTLEQAEEVRDPSMAMQAIGVGSAVVVSALAIVVSVATLGAPVFAADLLVNSPLIFLPAAALFSEESCIRTVAISPDGRTIVSTTKGPSHNVMAVIDRKKNKVVDKWTVDSYVCDMEFSADGRYLLTASTRGAYLYDTDSWKRTRLQEVEIKGNN